MRREWYHPERASLTMGLVCLVCMLLMGRVVHIQWYARDYYVSTSPKTPGVTKRLEGDRGRILDRNYRVLAESAAATTVSVCPANVQQWALGRRGGDRGSIACAELAEEPRLIRAARAIAAALDLLESEVLEKLCREQQYVVLAKRADADRAEELKGLVKEAGIRGLSFDPITRREYPFDSLASAVLGYCDGEQRPTAGVEASYQHVTRGQVIALGDRYDRWGRRILNRRTAGRPRPEPGKDLILTLDLGTQQIAEKVLDECWATRHPRGANVVVMSARDGRVLAMACRPTFNPNHISKAKSAPVPVQLDALGNRPVSRPMEPGSTFKLLTIAAGLEYGVITPSSVLRCNGTEMIGGKPLGCWGKWRTLGHGSLTPAGILANSCNIGAAKVALRIGPERLWAFVRRCGIGQTPRAGLRAETPGRLLRPASMRTRDLACLGFGQGVLVSDLQMAQAACAILNGGLLYQPRIVEGYLTPNSSECYETKSRVVRRVCSSATSETLRRMAAYAVEKGTGKLAQIPGFCVGGKTATAQIFDPAQGIWLSGPHDFVMSFVLAAPVDREPDFVVVVSVERPQVGTHASEVVAPMARRIAEHLLRHPELFPAPGSEPNETSIEPGDVAA